MLNYEFPWKQIGPIGLDIGHHSAKMIQLGFKQNHFYVVDAGKTVIPYQPGPDRHMKSVIATVKTMLSKRNFKGRSVVSSLSNHMMKFTSVRTSEADLVKAEAQLHLEAAYRFGLDPNRDPIRYLSAGAVLHGDHVKQEMILFGAQRESINRHIECLEAMSLEPVGLDPKPCALFRNLLQSVEPASDAQSTRVCIEIGYSDSTVVIGREGQICFVKQLPFGLFQLDNCIAEELGVSHKEAGTMRKELHLESSTEALSSSGVSGQQGPTSRQVIINCIRSIGEKLAKEVLLCLRYHSVTFRGEFVDGIHICGGGAYESFLLDVLEQHLSPAPQKIHPFATIKPLSQQVKAIIGQTGHEWAVAVGLAIKLMQKPDDEKSKGDVSRDVLTTSTM